MFRKLVPPAALATLLFAIVVPPANAALISFETSGVFGSTGTNTVTSNGVTLTFTGVVLEDFVVGADGSFTSFGTFDVTGGHASTGGLAPETFSLTLTPLNSVSIDAEFSSTLAGQINRNASNATVTFSAPTSQEIYGY